MRGVRIWRRVRGRQSHKGREEGTEEDRTQREERGGGDGSGGHGGNGGGGGGPMSLKCHGSVEDTSSSGLRGPRTCLGDSKFQKCPLP